MDLVKNADEIFQISKEIEQKVAFLVGLLNKRRKEYDEVKFKLGVSNQEISIDATIYKTFLEMKDQVSGAVETSYNNFIHIDSEAKKISKKQKEIVRNNNILSLHQQKSSVDTKKIYTTNNGKEQQPIDDDKNISKEQNIDTNSSFSSSSSSSSSQLTDKIMRLRMMEIVNLNSTFVEYKDVYSEIIDSSRDLFCFDSRKKQLISKYAITALLNEKIKMTNSSYRAPIDESNKFKIQYSMHRLDEERAFSPWIPLLVQEEPGGKICNITAFPPELYIGSKSCCIFEVGLLELKTLDEIRLTLRLNNDKNKNRKRELPFPIDSIIEFWTFFEDMGILTNYKVRPCYLHKEPCSIEEFRSRFGLMNEIYYSDKNEFDTSQMMTKPQRESIEKLFKISPCLVYRMIPITITPKSGRNPFGDIPMEITPGVEINEIEIKSLLECYESPIDLFSNNNLEEREFINEEEKNARELIDSISEHEKKFNQSLRETKNKKLTLPIFKLSGSYKRASEDLKKRLDV